MAEQQKPSKFLRFAILGAPIAAMATMGFVLYGLNVTFESQRRGAEFKKDTEQLIERVKEGYKPIIVEATFECGFPKVISVYNCEQRGENQKSIANDVLTEYLDGQSSHNNAMKCYKTCEERYQPFFARCALDKANKLMDIVDNNNLYSSNIPRKK